MSATKQIKQDAQRKSTTKISPPKGAKSSRSAAKSKKIKPTRSTARIGKGVQDKKAGGATRGKSGTTAKRDRQRKETEKAGPSNTPIPIEVRRFDPKAIEAAAEYFYANDPFKTHFMNALSILFPEGERFFIRSVLAYRNEVNDPKLLREIKQFCAQEAQHTLVHEAMNELAAQHGYPVEKLESMIRSELRGFSKLGKKNELAKRAALATTVCMEHFTAIIAYQKLTNRTDVEEGLDPAVSALFDWHALEETEHKGVAFDVYQATGGGPTLLKAAMLWSTLMFIGGLHINLAALLTEDGSIKKWATWKTGGAFLFGPSQGFFVRPFSDWLAFFKPGFHPWKQHEDLHIKAKADSVKGYLAAEGS